MLPVIVTSFISIAAAHFDYPGRPTIDDLPKFYQPKQITYLVIRSYISKVHGQDPICIHNKVHNLTGANLYFEQTYTYKSGDLEISHRLPVKATISRKDGYDVAPFMEAVTTNVFQLKRNYYFHYYDDKAHCAVLTFKDYSGTLRCELHTWKTTASYTYYGNCHDEYKYQCPGRQSHYVYLRDCPNAV
uniref:Lipocalin n=1 Tax=Rhipicephalus appendiculatus TaxID=34631 RepID=A0A131YTK0_RHIAP